MKTYISVTAVGVLFSLTGAFAGDLGNWNGSLKDGEEYPSLWEGLYVGATLGYGWGTSESTLDRGNNHGFDTNDPDGALLGATLGYNWRVGDRLIGGIEGDISIADISGEDHKDVYDTHLWETGWNSLVTLRGRLGYEIEKNLLYATAGLAAINSDEYIAGNNANETTDNTGWLGGWVIGLGIERQFSDRISGKIEYLHADFGENDGFTADDDPYFFDNDLDVIRIGLNYKIN